MKIKKIFADNMICSADYLIYNAEYKYYSAYKSDVTHFSALINRNGAFTFALVALEEIRRCARHAFWNDKKHLKGYLSDYYRRRGE